MTGVPTSPAHSMQGLHLTEEQQAMRDIARRYLSDRLDTSVVRRLMATDDGFDPSHWSEVAAMGWPATTIPEEHGGAGFGFTELAVLFEETGRTVATLPLLSTTLGAVALLEFGNDQQHGQHLPAIAAGDRRATVVLPVPGDQGVDVGETLSGTGRFVLDGHTADVLVVVGPGGAVVVPADRTGVTATVMDSFDPTRPLASITFEDVVIEDGDRFITSEGLVERLTDVAGAMLANEQVGLSAAVLDMGVAYAKERKQFGRAIGSFQAIKHMLADNLVKLESARSVAWHAARALDAGDPDEIAIAIPMAASLCSEVAWQLAADNIQVHGGIGFTWEHDAHLYLKRAKSARSMFGSPIHWRHELATALQL